MSQHGSTQSMEFHTSIQCMESIEALIKNLVHPKMLWENSKKKVLKVLILNLKSVCPQ